MKTQRYYLVLFPLLLCLGGGLLFWRALQRDPHEIPSPLVNQTMPALQLPSLLGKAPLTPQDFKGHWSLLNIWASWCLTCAQEHPFLLQIAKQYSQVPLFGLNYQDAPDAAQAWLTRLGDPFQKVGYDERGQASIDWGIYGVPETYLIDPQGVIRLKHVGPLTLAIWQEKFLPFITAS